ncbi:unnamed protein product [Moneuplotes crassus]|uniref:Uncharacterized protein n=1 Tax=Euplotes crassus TaxID=5936 RepID=A0AAD1Y4P7_EUPCR|nr:unnamed protein product [Moneuplotes crassus]
MKRSHRATPSIKTAKRIYCKKSCRGSKKGLKRGVNRMKKQNKIESILETSGGPELIQQLDKAGVSEHEQQSASIFKQINSCEKEQIDSNAERYSALLKKDDSVLADNTFNVPRKSLEIHNPSVNPKEKAMLRSQNYLIPQLQKTRRIAESDLGYRGRNHIGKESFIAIKNEHFASFESSSRSPKGSGIPVDSRLNLYKNPEEYNKLIRKEIRKKRRLMRKQKNSSSLEKVCYSKHGFTKIQDKELADIFLTKKKRRRAQNRSVDKNPIMTVHKPKFYKTSEKSSEPLRERTINHINVTSQSIKKNCGLPKISSRTPIRSLKLKQEDPISPTQKPGSIRLQVPSKSKFCARRKKFSSSVLSKLTTKLCIIRRAVPVRKSVYCNGKWEDRPCPSFYLLPIGSHNLSTKIDTSGSTKEVVKDYKQLLNFNFDKELELAKKTLGSGLATKKRIVQFQLPPLSRDKETSPL